MTSTFKRIIFWSLVSLFLIDSIIVYTLGTEDNKGKTFITEETKKGKLLYQKYNCTACHQLYGLGGYMGPDLTNVISAEGKGEMHVKAFLMSGTQRMPNFNLGESEINSLVEYLKYVDKTGISPVKKFEINTDVTITQK